MANSRLWVAASAIQIAANKVMHASAARKSTNVLKDAVAELNAAGESLGKILSMPDSAQHSPEEEAPRIPKARGVPTVFSGRSGPVNPQVPAAPAAPKRLSEEEIKAQISALEDQLPTA